MHKVRLYIAFSGNSMVMTMTEDKAKDFINKYQQALTTGCQLIYGENFTLRVDQICGIAYAKIKADPSEAWKYACGDEEDAD